MNTVPGRGIKVAHTKNQHRPHQSTGKDSEKRLYSSHNKGRRSSEKSFKKIL